MKPDGKSPLLRKADRKMLDAMGSGTSDAETAA